VNRLISCVLLKILPNTHPTPTTLRPKCFLSSPHSLSSPSFLPPTQQVFYTHSQILYLPCSSHSLKIQRTQLIYSYYDNLRCENGNPCGATWEPGWADSISTGITACESSTSTTPLGGYKSNQIVGKLPHDLRNV
jgi:hypothetical protein